MRPGLVVGSALTSITLVLIALTFASPVWSHSGATGVVKERMEAMKSTGKAMKTISKMLKGEQEFDAAEIKRNAQIVQRLSGDALTRLFPAGSLDEPSEGTAAIWEQWTRFEALSTQLLDRAEALSTTTTKEATAAAFAQLGAICKECHESFRIKKD